MNNLRFDTDLQANLPEWYKPVADYQQILGAEKTEFDALKSQVLAVYANLFIETMDAGALAQWEAIFGITPSPAETLDFRRARVLNRISMKPPYTERFLEQVLDELIGPGKYTLTVDSQNFQLTIETSASDQSFAIEVAYTINHTVPAHILYINKPVVYSNPIEISETISTIVSDWQYRLGSWVLGFAPFAINTTEEVIKVADTPSIEDYTLEELAGDFMALVDHVRINGSLTIAAADITKTQVDDTITIEYTLSNLQVASVTQIEVIDSSNNVLTDVSLYVPITQATTIKHVYPIKEGSNG